MIKDIKFNLDALGRMAQGVDVLAKTVGSTLGPGGRNVIFEWGLHPQVTKDGVTVARQVELGGKFESIGACMVRDVASKTCDDAGDGTTTATILAASVLKQGLQYIISGVNPIDIQRNLTEGAEIVVNFIRDNIRKEVVGDEDVKSIAMVSANWDENIADVVTKAVLEVGVDGPVEYEDTKKSTNVTLRFEEGMTFDRGFFNPGFINCQEKQTVEYENPYILLHRGTLRSWQSLLHIVSTVHKQNVDGESPAIILVADDFESNVLQSAYANFKGAARLKISFMRSPFYANHRDNSMDDLAVFLGTKVIEPGVGTALDQLQLSDLGRCRKLVQTASTTTFIMGGGDELSVKKHIENLKALQDPNSGLSDVDRANLELRIKKLRAKVAFINIGAHTEAEQNERRDRIDDAVCATRAALQEGVVPGGCYSYLKAIPVLEKEMKKADRAKQVAYTILIEALKQPFKRLMANVGMHDESYIILDKIIRGKKKNQGFDVKRKVMTDLIKAGVTDPFRVTRAALQNAVSVAGLILTAEAVVVDKEDENINVVQAQSIPSLF